MNRVEIVEQAREIVEDLSFGAARAWLAEAPGRVAAGYLPVYAPREVIHAAGMLPVGVHGGGDRLEIIRGDAYYQSYICHIPRSVVELGLTGRLDMLSAMLFPSTCDVIRNLSGMWQVLKPQVYVRYLDLPQGADQALMAKFWAEELRVLLRDLGAISGRGWSEEGLRASIATYNEVRQLIADLYALRREAPWRVPTEELYLLLRAAETIPPETFLERGRAYLSAASTDNSRPRDNTRVILVGSFCEQPPLGLIKTIERAGCYIVDDDLLLGNRLMAAPVPLDGDPVEALARTFVGSARRCSILYEPDPEGKKRLMADRARAARADGIIFSAPSFCDPALLDRPMLKAGAEAAGIPCIAFKYAENTGQFQQFREQAGTFSDAIKLWGGAA